MWAWNQTLDCSMILNINYIENLDHCDTAGQSVINELDWKQVNISPNKQFVFNWQSANICSVAKPSLSQQSRGKSYSWWLIGDSLQMDKTLRRETFVPFCSLADSADSLFWCLLTVYNGFCLTSGPKSPKSLWFNSCRIKMLILSIWASVFVCLFC